MDNINCSILPIIIDHKNGAVLTISSYVNNGGSTKAVKGSTVNYKVVVKNEGTSESTNNVITSKIPEGFKYVVGSASDNGEYIESTNSIRWNVSSRVWIKSVGDEKSPLVDDSRKVWFYSEDFDVAVDIPE